MAGRMEFPLPSLDDTERLASKVAEALDSPCVIALSGPLGAGKTTWVRALLQALGHDGVVPSPTYTLVEPYRISAFAFAVYHVDLYRMQSDAEFEALGLREHLDEETVMLIEWPERCPELLEYADLVLQFATKGAGDHREVMLKGCGLCGNRLLARTAYALSRG